MKKILLILPFLFWLGCGGDNSKTFSIKPVDNISWYKTEHSINKKSILNPDLNKYNKISLSITHISGKIYYKVFIGHDALQIIRSLQADKADEDSIKADEASMKGYADPWAEYRRSYGLPDPWMDALYGPVNYYWYFFDKKGYEIHDYRISLDKKDWSGKNDIESQENEKLSREIYDKIHSIKFSTSYKE